MANLINWFEIPVKDMQRAAEFYGAVLNLSVQVNDQFTPGFIMGMLMNPDTSRSEVSGALLLGEGYQPGQSNTLIYFNANETGGAQAMLDRVAKAGGTVHVQAFKISDDIGYCGFFTDCEGNRMAVHSKYP